MSNPEGEKKVEKSCPDHQLLSVYYDGEMPSPWKEKMENHIAGCSDCAKRLETYRHISRETAVEEAPVDEARARVWQRLEKSAAGREHTAFPAARNRSLWWRRKISVPVPAAVAAAVLLAVLTFAWIQTPGGPEEALFMSLASEAEVYTPGTILDWDMENVLQFLSQDMVEMMVIRLPETRNFVNFGEPVMINAADYSQLGRRRH